MICFVMEVKTFDWDFDVFEIYWTRLMWVYLLYTIVTWIDNVITFKRINSQFQ